MSYIYERKVNYYETDKMGVVHHSNYIRFLEEARCYFLESYDFPYSEFEKKGISIPVINVNCNYKTHVTFNDIIVISVSIKEYTGVRVVIHYELTNKKTGNIVMIAETKHCFTNSSIRPINLKKICPEFDFKFNNLISTD